MTGTGFVTPDVKGREYIVSRPAHKGRWMAGHLAKPRFALCTAKT
jgi:hypothetical protein